MSLRAISLIIFFGWILALPVQADVQQEMLAVDSAFAEGRYEQVELLALRILHSDSALPADERARLNLTAGYALIMLDHEDDARGYFSRALDAVPDLTLDPVQVSPKFRVIFDEVKAARPVTPISGGLQPSEEFGDSPRRDAFSKQAMRPSAQSQVMNLLIPGSGQWNEGKTLRGAAWFGLQAASVGVLVWRISEMRDSREAYLAETESARIADAYDTYNRDYRLAWAAGIAAGLVYIGSQADLTLMKIAEKRTALLFSPTAEGVRLAICW
ncbi:MAG: hypothetical protein PHI18_02555 [bacterium]|nr:hypothetical protein [bacterium]